MATGFVLNIPNEMLRRLDEADRKIEQLETTSNKAADAVVQSFLRMKNAGVDAFISSLNDANRALAAFNNVRPQNNGIQAVAAQATNSADEVHLLIASIYELIDLVGNGKGSKLKLIDSNDDSFKRIADLKAEIKEINAELDRGGTKETGAITKDRQDQLRNTREALKEELKWLEAGDVKRADMIEQRIRRAERAADAEIREAKRSYTEQAKAYQALNEKLNSTFEGAISFSQSAKTENRHAQAIEYLIAARKQLSTADSEYAAKLNTINVAIQEHQRFLKDATLTDQQRADAAAAAAEKVVQAVARERAAYEARKKAVLDQWYSSSDTRALSFNANAKNLDELTQSIKYMEAARNKLKITDDNYEARLRSLNEAIRLSQKVLKDATLTEEERAAAAQKTEEALRKRQAAEQFAAASSTPEKALAFSQNAQNINQQLEAIKALQIARDNLTNTDAQYENRVAALNAEIRRQQTEVDRLRGKSEELHKSHRNLMDISGQLARKLALVFSVSQVTGYINRMIQERGELELQQRSLQAILQNKEEANKLWNKTIALAVKSPFQIKELVTYTKQLAAYRVESSKLYDTTKMLADISAGLGVDMQRLILAYGQVKAANYLRGTELRQFSEAGINILGELAKYFSELEGSAVSVGEVFDRVSRRMVRFEDVEEIFKRLTSAGGTFYQMQEIQAETLQGKISNLKDSFAVMLNEIGAANDRNLKKGTDVVRSFVEHWEAVAVALKAVIALFAIYKIQALAAADRTMLLAIDMGVLNNVAPKTLSLVQLLQVGFKQLIQSLTKAGAALKSFLAANWYVVAIMALVGAIIALRRESKRLQAIALETADAHDTEIAKVRELTQKYQELAQAKRSAETKEQKNKIDRSIQSTLNEIQALAVEQGGVNVPIDVTADEESITNTVQQIYEQIRYGADFGEALSYSVKKAFEAPEMWGIIGENLQSDLQDLQNAYTMLSQGGMERRLQNAQNELSANYDQLNDKAKAYYDELRQGKRDNESEIDYLERRIRLLDRIRISLGDSMVLRHSKDIQKAMDRLVDLGKAQDEVGFELNKRIREVKESMGILEDTVLTEWQQRAIIAKIKMLPEFSQFGEQVESYVHTYLSEGFQIPLNFTIPTPDSSDNTWRDRLTKAIAKINDDMAAQVQKEGIKEIIMPKFSLPKQDDELDAYLAVLKGEMEAATMEFIDGQQAYDTALVNSYKIMEQYVPAVQTLINMRNQQTDTDGEANDILGEQLRLLKGVVDKSEELSKNLPQQKVVEALQGLYGAEWSKHLQTLGVDLDAFITAYFENSESAVLGVYDNIRKATKDKVEQTKVDVAKTEFKIDLQIGASEQTLDDLKQRIEGKFEEYDLWLDLQKLGFSPEIAQSMFGLDTISLDALNAAIEGSKDQFDDLAEEGTEAYAEYAAKVTELEKKAQLERLKTYVAYAKKSIGERAKIKFEELQHLQNIEKTFAAKEGETDAARLKRETTMAAAKEGVRKEAAEKIAKLNWEEFQQTETFLSIMGDLENASSAALTTMIEQLTTYKDQWTELPLENVKQIVDWLNKLRDAQVEAANPFKENRTLRAKINADGRTYGQAQEDLILAEQAIEKDEELLSMIEQINHARLMGVSAEEQLAYYGQAYADIIALSDPQLKQMEDRLKGQVAKNANIVKGSKEHLQLIQQLNKLYKKQGEHYQTINKLAADLYGAFEELYDVFGGDSDGIGKAFADMGMSMMTAVLNTLALQVQLKSAEVEAGTLAAAMNAAAGVIGWIVMAVQLLAAALSAAFKAHDQGLENQIERLTDYVENLQKQYERLEQAIDDAFNTSQMRSYTEQLKSTANAQISYLRAMIALEEDKKNTDEDRIKEWEDEIESLGDSLADALQNAVSKATAGILDDTFSVARDFVDAWYDSFQEVGNGISGLEDNFQEMFLNLIKQQAALQIAGDFIDRWKKYLDAYVDEEDLILTTEEAKKWAAQVKEEIPDLSLMLENLFGVFGEGVTDLTEKSSLSGLQKGISSITEETAQILEAYLNSVRFYVADSNSKLAQLVATWANPEIENPMLTNLKIIAKQTTDIHTLLESLTAPHPTESGRGLKVII